MMTVTTTDDYDVIWSGDMRVSLPGVGGVQRHRDYLTDYGATDGLFVKVVKDPRDTDPLTSTGPGRPVGPSTRCRCGRVIVASDPKWWGRRPKCRHCRRHGLP